MEALLFGLAGIAGCCGLLAIPLLLFRKLTGREEEAAEEQAAAEGTPGRPLAAGRRKIRRGER